MNILKGIKVAAGLVTAGVGAIVALKAGKSKETEFDSTLEELGGGTETEETNEEIPEAEAEEVPEEEESES